MSVLYTSLPEARELGALALFGETYDETVRVVEIGGPWSIELCGGTHVEHSSQIGPVSLLGESSVGSGIRRIEASVGIEAFRHLAAERAMVAELAGLLKVPPAEVPGRVENLVERLRVAEKELEKVRAAAVLASAGALAAGAADVNGIGAGRRGRARRACRPVTCARWPPTSAAGSAPGRRWWRCSVRPTDTVSFVVATTPAAVDRGLRAGDLVKAFLPDIEGRGGGKPDLAQGGGSRPDGVPAAIETLRAAVAGSGSVTARRTRGGSGGADMTSRDGVRLGVDVGSVRVGVAISDPHGILATPVSTVPRDVGRWHRSGADRRAGRPNATSWRSSSACRGRCVGPTAQRWSRPGCSATRWPTGSPRCRWCTPTSGSPR